MALCSPSSAAYSVLGNVVLLHHLHCMLLGLIRLHMNHWVWYLLPCSLGSLH